MCVSIYAKEREVTAFEPRSAPGQDAPNPIEYALRET